MFHHAVMMPFITGLVVFDGEAPDPAVAAGRRGACS